MIKHLFFSCLLIGFIGAASTLYAQPVSDEELPLMWGEVPREHLEMDAYAADSNATAVILADYGNVYFDSRGEMVFERHTRIKILTEAGYEWGDVAIEYYAKERAQRVRGVKGQTFTLGPGGKVMLHKLGRKDIFTEDVDGERKRVRFTLPALQPGAVIEYRYTIDSDNPVFLPGWQFQHSEPTRWSEYRAKIPAGYNYVTASIGVLNFAVQDTEQTAVRWDATRHRWAMKDVPALREEPFMTTPEDYRAAMQFQLASIQHPSIGHHSFLSTWEELADELMDASWFGKQVKPRRAVSRRVEALTVGVDDPVERMRLLYDFVRTTVTWNGELGFAVDQDVDDVLEMQRGSSPEIALLLVSMLRAAGLQADPVLISTRSHGAVVPHYPLVSQFNDVLACVEIDGTRVLLDATDPLRPYGLLPTEALSGSGWLVREGAPAWIPIEATGSYQHQAFIDATLDADGKLTGTLQTSDGGYSALTKRHLFKDAEDEASFVRDVLFEQRNDMLLETHAVQQLDEVTERLRAEAAFSIPNYAQVAGDFIYFHPQPLGRTEENPLRLPERTFPIDMAYPRRLSYTVRMALPEGYALQETPRNVRIQLPLSSGFYQRVMQVQDGLLTVQTVLQIKRTVFKPDLYQELRRFFDRMVEADAEQVVLQRMASAASSSTEGNGR